MKIKFIEKRKNIYLYFYSHWHSFLFPITHPFSFFLSRFHIYFSSYFSPTLFTFFMGNTSDPWPQYPTGGKDRKLHERPFSPAPYTICSETRDFATITRIYIYTLKINFTYIWKMVLHSISILLSRICILSLTQLSFTFCCLFRVCFLSMTDDRQMRAFCFGNCMKN